MNAEDRDKLRKLAIVPAYHEEEMVGKVVRDIRRAAADFDVVVIDDGSTDGTAAAAEAYGALVIRHPFNLGIGGAMQSGYKYALSHGYDVAVQIDGDGQHKPSYLPAMVEALHTTDNEADMVTGSRFLGEPGYKVPLGRRTGNLIFSVLLTLIVRRKITDPTSGYRMTNRKGIELFARDYPHDYPEVEAILMMHHHRLAIHEIHMEMNARGFGSSSIDYPRSAYYMVKVLLGDLRRAAAPPADTDGRKASRHRRLRRRRPERRDRGRRCRRGTGRGHAMSGPLMLIAQTAESDSIISSKVQVLTIVFTALFLIVVIELVRRRKLVERYALLWMLAAFVPLPFAIWRDGLDELAGLVGIESPPNALFLIGLGIVFALLLHFSVVSSRLGEETKILAQEVARLDAELRVASGRAPAANGNYEEAEKANLG